MVEINEIKKILKDHEKRISILEGKTTAGKQKSQKLDSIGGLIVELKKDDFFKNPKTFNEIQKELQRRGHYYNRTSLSKPLLSLVKKKTIGRIGKKKNWKYVSR